MSGIKKPYFEFYKHGEPKTYFNKKLKKNVTRSGGSQCSKCGVTMCKGNFYRLFVPVSWSRGDDEYKGIYCEGCKTVEEKV